MKQTRKLTEGAVLLAVYAILLLITLYIPIIGSIVNLFIALPFIFFAAKNDWKNSLVFLMSSVLLSLIVGTILAIPLALAYGMTGIVIGSFIRMQRSRSQTFIAASIVFLINLVGAYVVSIIFFNVNYITESFDLIRSSTQEMNGIMSTVDEAAAEKYIKGIKEALDLLESLIPSLFVLSSFIIVFFIQLVSIPIIKRFGIIVDGWKPFRDLTLPKSLLWYFLLVLIASYIIKPEEGSYWFAALVNIIFILQLFMTLQGLSLVYYFTYVRGLPKALPIIITILLFVMPLILSIIRILGIMDLGFNLRKRFTK